MTPHTRGRQVSGAAGGGGGPARHTARVGQVGGRNGVLGGAPGGSGPRVGTGKQPADPPGDRVSCSSGGRLGRPAVRDGPAGGPAAAGRCPADVPVRPHRGWPVRRGPARSRPAPPTRLAPGSSRRTTSAPADGRTPGRLRRRALLPGARADGGADAVQQRGDLHVVANGHPQLCARLADVGADPEPAGRAHQRQGRHPIRWAGPATGPDARARSPGRKTGWPRARWPPRHTRVRRRPRGQPAHHPAVAVEQSDPAGQFLSVGPIDADQVAPPLPGPDGRQRRQPHRIPERRGSGSCSRCAATTSSRSARTTSRPPRRADGRGQAQYRVAISARRQHAPGHRETAELVVDTFGQRGHAASLLLPSRPAAGRYRRRIDARPATTGRRRPASSGTPARVQAQSSRS